MPGSAAAATRWRRSSRCWARPPNSSSSSSHDYIAQGDKVVVLGHERQRVKATGLTVENDFAMVFTIRDGKIARFRNYEDTAAVAAAHRKA